VYCKYPSRVASRSIIGLTIRQTDCWNEAAGSAGCDPNVDDECLCGPFFDDVASCTAALCNAGENLGTSQFFMGFSIY
jgi:cyclophilin family peptidyl-prolyl cis-trans isomerase